MNSFTQRAYVSKVSFFNNRFVFIISIKMPLISSFLYGQLSMPYYRPITLYSLFANKFFNKRYFDLLVGQNIMRLNLVVLYKFN